MRSTLKGIVVFFMIVTPLAVALSPDLEDVTMLPALAAEPEAATQPAERSIEVCFVLDTTGSMGGLIEGAKKKIWTIANAIVSAGPKANVRFALVPYRDRGDEYVTKVFDLTDDLDKVFADLQTFDAQGGGDGPESVNAALADAVNKVAWSPGDDVVKLIFLVGDFPPHMDYQDDVKYPQTCEAAVKKNLIINTVQCGGQEETRTVWQDIAKRSEGSYVALEQSGGMVVAETPMDKEIAELSTKIAALAVPYGSARQQQEVAAKNSMAATSAAPVAAERAAYNAKSFRAIQGAGDLVTDARDGTVDLGTVKEDELTPAMQKMSPDERKAFLAKQAEERDKLTARVNELSKQRTDYLADEAKKATAAGKGDAFDAKVSEMVQAEVTRKK